MPNKENQIKQQPVQNIPEAYTNAVKVFYNQQEFEVTCGLGSSNYEGIRPVVNLRMSPQFAKEFIEILKNNMDGFEKHFGEVKLKDVR